MITLTSSLIHQLGTKGAGFTYAQLRLLGVETPPPKGWLSDLVGTRISEDTYNACLALRKSAAPAVHTACKSERRRAKRRRQQERRAERKQMAVWRIDRSLEFIDRYGYEQPPAGELMDLAERFSACDQEKLAAAIAAWPYQRFLRSGYWRTVAAHVKKNASYRCRLCRSPDRLNVHHNTYEHHGREHEYWQEDLICLCEACHAKFHDKLKKG